MLKESTGGRLELLPAMMLHFPSLSSCDSYGLVYGIIIDEKGGICQRISG
jgi:hypothetical protein